MPRNIGKELILCKTCIKGYDSKDEKKFCIYAPLTFCSDYSPNIWGELDLDRWTWEVPRETSGPYVAEHIPKPLIVDWVKKWKPIIDDALKTAEKWDFWIHGDAPPRIKHVEMVEGKLKAIETLMREDRRITIIRNNQYSIQPWGSGDKLASSIMAILFPDDPSSGGTQ